MKNRIIAAACTLALSGALPFPAHALIRKCVGPGGDVKFTNSACPEGYVQEASRAASQPTSAGEAEDPDICRFSSILAAEEVAPAIAEAESALAQAKEKGDDDLALYWQDCLGGIRQREVELQSRARSPAEESAPEDCREGTFDYREGGVYFTSSTRAPCTGVRAVCTFDVRESQRVTGTERGILGNRRTEGSTTTTGQRVRNFDYGGRVGRWGTVRIGDANLSGRVTGWNCVIER